MMIFGEENDRGGRKFTAAMGTERTKPLHNFEMPCLKWSNQRILRCMKVDSQGQISSLYASDRRFVVGPEVGKDFVKRRSPCEDGRSESVGRVDLMEASPSAAAGCRASGRKSQTEGDGDHGIETFKAQLIFDFQKAVGKLNNWTINEGSEEVQPAPPPSSTVRPWNMRKRRAECNDFNSGGAVSVEGAKRNSSPLRTEEVPGRKRVREKFSVVLSRKEIEEDFMALTGKKAPRRPKKWPKNVQKDLDNLFPGFWMTEITADMYEVPEAPESSRKR